MIKERSVSLSVVGHPPSLVEKILQSSAGLGGARVCDHHTGGATGLGSLIVPLAVTRPLHVVELVPDATSSVIVAKTRGEIL